MGESAKVGGSVLGVRRSHGVTLGAKEIDITYNPNQRPTLGFNVIKGSGAKQLGGITLGKNAKVGANAVTVDSFPDNAVLGGIRATALQKLEAISA